MKNLFECYLPKDDNFINEAKELINKLISLKDEYDKLPVENSVGIKKVYDDLLLHIAYNSSAIEGNKIDIEDYYDLIYEGITPNKHTKFNDCCEVINLVGLMQSIDIEPLNKSYIYSQAYLFEIHRKLFYGFRNLKINVGRYKSYNNCVSNNKGGKNFVDKSLVESYMDKLNLLLKESLLNNYPDFTLDYDNIYRIFEVASIFHHIYINIHPFEDGNGRTCRILLSRILSLAGLLPPLIKFDSRMRYYEVLDACDKDGNLEKLFIFLLDSSINSYNFVLNK